jgi:hypothetical protein
MKQIAKAFGPNDECVQVEGLVFKVNISAKLVAEKINVAIYKISREEPSQTRKKINDKLYQD